jgi:hypothetical protein
VTAQKAQRRRSSALAAAIDRAAEAEAPGILLAAGVALGTRSYNSVAAILKNAQERKPREPDHPAYSTRTSVARATIPLFFDNLGRIASPLRLARPFGPDSIAQRVYH